MKRVYFFRHGQTDWNKEGRIQGHLDVPLNETGRSQARLIIPQAHRLGVEAFLSSDLSRAKETAEIVAAQLQAPVFTDPGLREIHLGRVQGLSRQEIADRLGIEFSERLRNQPLSDADVEILGSESGEEVRARAFSAAERFLHEHPFQTIGIVSHGGVIRRILQSVCERREFPAPVPNGCLFPFFYDLEQRKWSMSLFMPFLGSS